MKTLKQIYAPIGPYKADVVLLIGDYEQIPAWAKRSLKRTRQEEVQKLWEEKNSPTTEGRMFPLSGGGAIIWLPKRNLPVLVHEIAHTVHHLMVEKGIPLGWEGTETLAYLSEYLFEKLSA